MTKKTLFLFAMVVPFLTIGAGCTSQEASNQTNFDYTTSSSETDISYPVVEFTAVYDNVSIFDEAFGGNLVSIDPDTKYMQEEMFRKVVYFLPGAVKFLNGESIGGTQFIGMDKPVNNTKKKGIPLPKSQRLKIKGFYHKKQHTPYAEVVESIESTAFENENYTFEYPQEYSVTETGKENTYILTVSKSNTAKLEIFKASEYPVDRAAVGFSGEETPAEADAYMKEFKASSAKEYFKVGSYDVWLYYNENDSQAKNELKAIFDSIK